MKWDTTLQPALSDTNDGEYSLLLPDKRADMQPLLGSSKSSRFFLLLLILYRSVERFKTMD